jgi:hypothetical protein
MAWSPSPSGDPYRTVRPAKRGSQARRGRRHRQAICMRWLAHPIGLAIHVRYPSLTWSWHPLRPRSSRLRSRPCDRSNMTVQAFRDNRAGDPVRNGARWGVPGERCGATRRAIGSAPASDAERHGERCGATRQAMRSDTASDRGDSVSRFDSNAEACSLALAGLQDCPVCLGASWAGLTAPIASRY